jgi:hypothetical protein
MTLYAEISAGLIVTQALDVQDGPGIFDPLDGHTYRMLDAPPELPQPSPTSVLKWADDWPAPRWVETATLAELVARAVAAIDAQADAARLTVSPPGRDLEYSRAEAQAQAYKDAAYTGDVPTCVDSWARAKQWTPQNAATDILATAALWYSALDGIRDLRLNAKEAVRRVTGPGADIAPIVAQFETDLQNLMQGLING